MELAKIPEVVIFGHIFPHLQLNDLLRLRSVSRLTKPLAEDYLRLHVTSQSERSFRIDLDNPERNLSALLALDFVVPYSRFFIDNERHENKIWKDEQLQEFVERYGEKITHLEIGFLELPIVSRKAIKFFESLPNLEHFEITRLTERGFRSKGKKGIQTRASNAKELPNLIPSTFKRLQTLRLYDYNCTTALESASLVWKFVEECSSQLRFLRHPDYGWDSNFNLENLPGGRFGSVIRMLESGLGSSPHLKFYDIRDSWEGRTDSPSFARDFYRLVTACSKSNVKLLHVDAEMIEGMMKLETWDMEEHGRKISNVVASLRNLHRSSFLLELPHLEKIFVGDPEGTWVNCSMPYWEFERQAWPNLKKMEIWVDSEYLAEIYGEPDVETVKLLDYLFVGIRREKMECLNLSFHLCRYYKDDTLPYPRILDICGSCPNLKKVSLSGWSGSSDKAVSKMWSDLPFLEEVEFEGCKDLGNVAFVGGDRRNPSLFKAKNLRIMKLSELELMPKITDRLFTRVLRHMPLKELLLQASCWKEKPLYSVANMNKMKVIRNKITIGGIASLLIGTFSETIEKLSFDIKLGGVTKEEMTSLKNKFRSTDFM